MLKAQVKSIDFGIARHLKNEELAHSTLGSPIYMEPGILKKLIKAENYGIMDTMKKLTYGVWVLYAMRCLLEEMVLMLEV